MFLVTSNTYMYNFILITLAFKVFGADQHPEFIHENVGHYQNKWAIQVPRGLNVAKKIIEDEGFLFERELPDYPNVFTLQHPTHPDRMQSPSTDLINNLKRREEVEWAGQIVATKKVLNQFLIDDVNFRSFVQKKLLEKMICPTSKDPNAVSLYKNLFNDPLWNYQWCLHDCRAEGSNEPYDHLNVVRVWKEYKLFGKGIVIGVLDSGLEKDHSDLENNFRTEYSYDFVGNYHDPFSPPTTTNPFFHGTLVAGVIAMRKDNNVCGAGIASEVALGDIRVEGSRNLNDQEDADAFLFQNDKIHIKNCSWGVAKLDGSQMRSFGPFTADALKTGTFEGRQKNGVIYVFGAGNERESGGNCAAEPFVNSLYTIVAASADRDGRVTYSERCAAVMITTYSGLISTNIGNDCSLSFSGTSASAPVVSAAVALALQANPNLSWRSVHHLFPWSGQIAPFRHSKSCLWIRNKAGFYFSADCGFGMLDVHTLVTNAMMFQEIPPMSTCVKNVVTYGSAVKFNRVNGVLFNVETNSCNGRPAEINYVEHVQIYTTIEYTKRGDIQIILESPSGTKMNILEPRKNDFGTVVYGQIFDSLHAWGENSNGLWKICVFDDTGFDNNEGMVLELYLIIYGTKRAPAHYTNVRPYNGF